MNPVPDCAALRAGISPVKIVERRIWISRVPPYADIPELEPKLPENAMRSGRVWKSGQFVRTRAVDFWREKESVRV